MKLNTNTLKIIGIISMLIAHIVYLFISPDNILFYILGFISRYTMLIFSYLLVIGFSKTKNLKKYLLRMFIFAILSQPFFNYFINGDFLTTTSLNIMFTMFITLIFIYIHKMEKDIFIKFFVMLSLYVLSYFCDWGMLFIPITFIFYIFESKANKKLRNILISIILIIYICFQTYKLIYLGFFIQLYLINFLEIEKSNKFNLKYFFYIFYPLHMFLLRLIYAVFN